MRRHMLLHAYARYVGQDPEERPLYQGVAIVLPIPAVAMQPSSYQAHAAEQLGVRLDLEIEVQLAALGAMQISPAVNDRVELAEAHDIAKARLERYDIITIARSVGSIARLRLARVEAGPITPGAAPHPAPVNGGA